MRICTKCGETKPLRTGYYRHSFGKDGYQTKCIECAKSDARENRAARIEYYRAYDRMRAKEPHRADERTGYNKANPRTRLEKDPIKRAARVVLGNALRDDKILRPPECEVCSYSCKPHGHHDDYLKPLDVIWVCTACHTLIHAYWRAQERMASPHRSKLEAQNG